ncbi:MAG: calcineurin-like phosphoesterase C-terminal domain-containing protein [Bacteroidales bacterium]|nr:calcineurin-like phosphoesterase C-terminal domain-containing protein [Bacteroidales bacterium]
MKKFLWVFSLAAALCCVLSCKQKEDPDTSADILITRIVLPSKIEAEPSSDVTLDLIGDTHILKTDEIVFQSVSNNSFACSIASVTTKKLVFTLNEGLVNGQYTFFVKRGSTRKKVGTTELSLIVPVTVELPEGTNIYGRIACGDNPVPGVIVSDGYEVTTTNDQGIYFMNSLKENGYVFMTIPSGYSVPGDGILPEFHASVGTDPSKVSRVDFTLIEDPGEEFTMFVLGDMHLANRNSTTSDMTQFDGFASDLNKTLSATSGKKYILTLGDMTWDLYWYDNKMEFLQYLALMNEKFKDIQVFHTMGNHDNDMNETGDFAKEFKYRRDVAPTYYSYNIGKIHFIVLDDIDYNNTGTGADLRSEYKRDVTARQMDWLAKDLSYVPKGTQIVVSTHAPIYMPTSSGGWSANLTGANSTGEANTAALVAAFSGYDVTFLTGHTHKTFVNDKMSSSHFRELNAGSVCGDWWWSGHLSPGHLMAQDGAPSGYTMMHFKGNACDWRYRSLGKPADYQFRAYDMNKVRETVTMSLVSNGNTKFKTYVDEYNSSKFSANDILLNIWNHDPSWTVSVTENGTPLTAKSVYTYDPLHVVAMSAKRLSQTANPSFITDQWIHFFRYTASSANSTIVIKVTDRFGNVSTETMTRPKTFSINNY